MTTRDPRSIRIPLRVYLCAIGVAALWLGESHALFAQSSAPLPASVRRPYRGIFGGPQDTKEGHSLDLFGAVYGAYDDNLVVAVSEPAERSWTQRSGSYWGTSGGLDYRFSKLAPRVTIDANSAAQFQYRPGIEQRPTAYYDGGVDVSFRLRQSTTLTVNERVSFAPNYTGFLAPGLTGDIARDAIGPSDPSLELFPLRTFRTGSDVMISQRFGRSTALSVGYQLRTFNVVGDETSRPTSRFRDYRTQSGSIGLNHTRRLSSSATLVLGYNLRAWDNNQFVGAPSLLHDINAGVNYSRALSFSRRTSLTFGTGSAIVVDEELDVPNSERRTQVRLLGNVNLLHEIGRTWTAQLSYVRGLASADGFTQLFFNDSLSTTVQGLISRRLALSGNATWEISQVATDSRNDNGRIYATAQATYALNRYAGLYTSYIYYRSTYGDELLLDPRLPRQLDRQGVRVGLTGSIPLIR